MICIDTPTGYRKRDANIEQPTMEPTKKKEKKARTLPRVSNNESD